MSYVEEQAAHFRHADADHFRWQTEPSPFADAEAALLGGVRAAPGERLLELGCGEGGNLHHLRRALPGVSLWGCDFAPARAAFAAAATGARVVVADAGATPFASGSFDAVVVRDVLHHLPDREAVLREVHRLLRPGGRLTLVEPNRWSPLALAQAAVVPAERGVLRSTAACLRRELAATGFTVRQVEMQQPLPLSRVLGHPLLGWRRLAGGRIVAGAERMAGRLLPRGVWLYVVCQALRP